VLFDEQERDLDELLLLSRTLGGQARTMGAALDEHHERLSSLGNAVENANGRSKKLTIKAKSIIDS